MPSTKACECCGKEFPATRHGKRNCSAKCAAFMRGTGHRGVVWGGPRGFAGIRYLYEYPAFRDWVSTGERMQKKHIRKYRIALQVKHDIELLHNHSGDNQYAVY